MSRMNMLAVFAGQGAQFKGMAASLVERETFMEGVRRCSEAYKKFNPNFDIAERVVESDGVEVTTVGQPLLAAVQIGLAGEKGRFKYYVGHSLGEVAAAVGAGIMDIEEAMGLVYYRSEALKEAFGEMCVVMASGEKAREVIEEEELGEEVSVAAVNDDKMTTLCGRDLTRVKEVFKANKIPSKAVPVNYAFHSSLITPSHVATLQQNLSTIFKPHPPPPTGTYYPTGLLTEPQLTTPNSLNTYEDLLLSFNPRSPSYWAQQIRNPVGFSVTLKYIKELDPGLEGFEEIGPREVLSRAVKPVFL
eukprot:TRINITY_DN10682_c0_g1_i1.p1 TRINITY_DN10682_c0_g1~~TRINITY_DN10682_c0_g1_i1.p1  ORF type:complete len:304 (+),score=57.28 TRINITY_DN10682_c0_g1_i1:53-964(+)